ncbi:hypothetical protein [Cochlodiniinecator piscidefendens]|uniref:hypothetical protein n=1 Tax=Cochlodiniinecator piscidefendens TaxID=2715756 RepID=UPI00140ADF3C|nr:hypothetical protein [Cochlodiniinecator piscidefendens]
MAVDTVEVLSAEIFELMGEKLSVRGGNLAERVRKAGRMLPRHVRREVGYLIEAIELSEHPKFASRVDERRVKSAHRVCLHHLKSVNVADRRIGTVLTILGGTALAIILVGAGLIAVLTIRGYI